MTSCTCPITAENAPQWQRWKGSPASERLPPQVSSSGAGPAGKGRNMTGTQRLLPPATNGNSPVVPVTYSVHGGAFHADPGEDELWSRISHYLGILKHHGWKIVSLVVLSMIATAIVSSRLTPIYESATTIDLDRHVPAGVLGQESVQYPGADADQFLATQLKLIQSD